MLPRYFGGLRMGKFKRRLRNSKKGVSEIIANILILAITVTLFSSIMIFVGQMPSPQKNAYVDVTPSVEYLPITDQVQVNLAHKGGQELVSNDTGLYYFVNDSKYIVPSTQIVNSVGARWTIGEILSFKYNATSSQNIYKLRISVMITDKEKNSMVYSANVVGGSATVNTPPIIGSRGTTPSPTYENMDFSFYAQIVDLDNDLDTNSVRIDLTAIGQGSNVQMVDTNGDGIFTAGTYIANLDWNGAVVVVTCSDMTGNMTSGQITLTIYRTSNTIIYQNSTPNNELPMNIDMSGLQGFNIFEWSDWEANAFNATPDREFDHGQVAVVVVVSKYLVNLNTENILLVMDQTSKDVIPSVSSPANIFVRYNFISGYYIYNVSIDTGLLTNHAYYQLQMQLRDSWVPNNIFFANDMIKVGAPSPYPSIITYKDAAFHQQSKDFNSTDIIYVEVMNKYGGAWYQYAGDVEIRDFFWNAQVKRTPATGGMGATTWNGPVSNVWNTVTPTNAYRFEINLQNATDGATWIPGKNTYNLRYDMFKAGSETYLLTKLVNITAPKWKADIVVGGLLVSGGRYSSPASMFYYKNDNQWSPPDLLEMSSDKNAYDPDVKLVRTGDMDQDGKSDIVAVREVTKGTSGIFLSWYKNMGTSWTRYDIATLTKIPSKLALGNIDLDNDLDLVIGYTGNDLNNAVWLYRNDGIWSKLKIGELAGNSNGVTALEIADMDYSTNPGNDANRSLDIVVGRANGIVTVYKNTLGTGTSWTPASVSGTTADAYSFATSDIPVSGNVTGTYDQTENPYQDDGIYEQLTEELIQDFEDVTPTSLGAGANDTVPDDISNLQLEDGLPYTVSLGIVAEVKQWDSTGLYNIYPNYTVEFNVLVRTTAYSGNDYITLWSNRTGIWTSFPVLEITTTSGVYENKKIDITNYVKTELAGKPSNIVNLLASFKNTNGGYVDFDYWSINVTYTLGDGMEHIWTMDVRDGTSHTFQVYALRSPISGGDNIRFAYSLDAINWVNMVTVTDTSLPSDLYTFALPSTLPTTIYIKVNDTVRSTSSPVLDWIRVGQMSVKTLASVSVIGVQVLSLDVSDINKDGSNDLLVVTKDSTNKGRIYVGLNAGGDVLTGLTQVVTPNAKYNSVISAQAGIFFDSPSKARLDIMVSTSSTVYMLRYNGLIYVEDYKVITPTTSGSIIRVMAGDVDSNGLTDLVVITTGTVGSTCNMIWLYANYKGTPTGWQTYLVDNLSDLTVIKDCDIGRLSTS
jgi:hypothetical protein